MPAIEHRDDLFRVLPRDLYISDKGVEDVVEERGAARAGRRNMSQRSI
jgi:hypothetical protein